jgi:predicted NBD/HSP70 family sugar kinase
VPQGNITQTVLGSPSVYDRRRDVITLAPALPGWNKPSVLAELRKAFGDSLVIENDVDAAALAERAYGHRRDVDTFVFVSIGTGIGMGLVLEGRLHRGAHGIAGEIGYLSSTTVPAPTPPTLVNAAFGRRLRRRNRPGREGHRQRAAR